MSQDAPASDARSQERPTRGRYWWLRWAIIAAAAIVLAVELTLVWDQLAKAWRSVYSANWWWVLASIIAAMASMHSFAQIQRTLLRSAGVTVRQWRSEAAFYAGNALSTTLPGGLPGRAITLTGQTLIIFMVSIALILALFLFFERTLHGKALRATAVNRLGARLMGISTAGAGRLSFGLAAFIGALSGLLIGPATTMFYDSGFLIGLKGFVAAIFGALASYPAAALGAIFVGLIESFGSFWASAFKEVIVFTLIIPVLLWRSFQHGHGDDEE